MKKNEKLIFCSMIAIMLLVTYIIWNSNKGEATRIQINGISTFNPIPSQNNNHFLLFYPADNRVSQGNTIVKEVDNTGAIVREYEVIDKDFRRMIVHQKPNNIDHLYISFFGEATIDNYYFTYDIKNRTFDKIALDYFDYPVGVDHILHYGNHTLFQNIVSHNTGDQNINVETHEFNVSISDYDQKESFETEYGYVPKWSPLLGFSNKILYATTGTINDKDEIENASIALIDLSKQQVQYETFDNPNADYFPLYSSDKHAYILGNTGKLYAFDTDFQYKTFEPFKDLPVQDWYYSEEDRPLLIDEDKILTSVYNEDKGSTVGLIELDSEPIFKPLKKSYLKPNFIYKFLYQDTEKQEIYILQRNEEEEYLLVIDNKTYDLKGKLPIEYSHLLDFVIRI